jgi:hypothetical protein
MLRFAGPAVGYPWMAISYPTGHLLAVYGSPFLSPSAWRWPRSRLAPPRVPHSERLDHDHR